MCNERVTGPESRIHDAAHTASFRAPFEQQDFEHNERVDVAYRYAAKIHANRTHDRWQCTTREYRACGDTCCERATDVRCGGADVRFD